jgi:hypothetical protein
MRRVTCRMEPRRARAFVLGSLSELRRKNRWVPSTGRPASPERATRTCAKVMLRLSVTPYPRRKSDNRAASPDSLTCIIVCNSLGLLSS